MEKGGRKAENKKDEVGVGGRVVKGKRMSGEECGK